ncbi:hypothetical protein MRX96_021135 [Rhipicephalus microplus]
MTSRASSVEAGQLLSLGDPRIILPPHPVCCRSSASSACHTHPSLLRAPAHTAFRHGSPSLVRLEGLRKRRRNLFSMASPRVQTQLAGVFA